MSTSDGQQNRGNTPRSEAAPQAGEPGAIPLPLRLFTTGLYTGYAPFAPGSVASLLAVLVYLLPGFELPPVMLSVITGSFLLGVHSATRMERLLGHDPRIVVIDEIVGMWVSLALLPKHPGIIALAFFIFRLLDILKPFPARQSERLRGGWGIMLDDLIAGVYTNLFVRIFLYLYQL
ncbi:MAG TPA: phosphatidylglycerophosphatase A [Bacteroidota bacterium]